ncbi:MAG: very short patch repair endonuclease [Chloroflexota bacterium]
MVRDATTTSRIMRAVKHRDSTAELAVRRRLWANGLRYRLGMKLPGKPDLAFPAQRIVVFIDGDLWHGNSWRNRGLPSLEAQFPTRTEWWVAKIRRNMERDSEVNAQLAAAGWTVLRFWESETLTDPNRVTRSIVERIRGSPVLDFRDLPVSSVERRRLGSVRPTRYMRKN